MQTKKLDPDTVALVKAQIRQALGEGHAEVADLLVSEQGVLTGRGLQVLIALAPAAELVGQALYPNGPRPGASPPADGEVN